MNSLLNYYVKRHVQVKVDSVRVRGTLLSFQENSKATHLPLVLVLESEDGRVLIRGNFESISELKKP